MTVHADDVRGMLQAIAHARTQETFANAVDRLKASQYWNDKPVFQGWINNTWLKHVQVSSWNVLSGMSLFISVCLSVFLLVFL